MVTAEEVLRRRVMALLNHTGRTQKDLAIYLGHSPSWTTEFFQRRHGATLKDLDRMALFFGLAVPQLFELDGYRFRDRRRGQRRCIGERRLGKDRRKGA